jgi:hypothetical protein
MSGGNVSLPMFSAELSLERYEQGSYADASYQRASRQGVVLAENCSGGGGVNCQCDGKCHHGSGWCSCLRTEMTVR